MSGPQVFGSNPYAANQSLTGEVVTVLRGTTSRRGLALEEYRSRAVIRGHVHEVMVTDEQSATPGRTVDSVGLIAFVAMHSSGVLLVDAPVLIGSTRLGSLAGFDDTHMPNHQNICVRVERLVDGVELDLEPGSMVYFGAPDGSA